MLGYASLTYLTVADMIRLIDSEEEDNSRLKGFNHRPSINQMNHSSDKERTLVRHPNEVTMLMPGHQTNEESLMTNLTITLNDVLLEKAIQKASTQGLSVEELVCDYLEDYVAQPTKPLLSARPIGLAKGTLSIPDAFFEPLPEELLEVFEGSSL